MPSYYSLGDHTETVDLEFDPSVTSYENLLKMFWNNHDSTACHNRQYMSAIFYHGDEQKALAEKTRDEHQKTLKRKIQTVIKPAETFYDAEDYHQKYMLRQHRSLLKSLNLSPKDMIKSHTAARLNGYVAGFGKKASFEKEQEKLGLNEEQTEYMLGVLGRGGR